MTAKLTVFQAEDLGRGLLLVFVRIESREPLDPDQGLNLTPVSDLSPLNAAPYVGPVPGLWIEGDGDTESFTFFVVADRDLTDEERDLVRADIRRLSAEESI
jgi:hypothetical protein